MPYGTIKVDNITFDNGGTDKLLTVSGLFFSTSGALTVTGTISGGNVTAPTATFTTLTGTTTAGTTATFTSGSFTSLTGVSTIVTSGIFSAGSATAPSVAVGTGTTYKPGIYSPGADQLAIATGGTGRIIVDGSGNVNIDSNTLYVDAVNNRVGIGATSVSASLGFGTSVDTTPTDVSKIQLYNNGGAIYGFGVSANQLNYRAGTTGDAHVWYTGLGELARIDSSGRLLVGTSSSSGPALLTVQSNTVPGTIGNQGVLDIAFNGTPASDNTIGQVRFTDQASAGNAYASIACAADATPGSGDYPGRLVFSTTADGAASPTERMRITSDGNGIWGDTSTNPTNGHVLNRNGGNGFYTQTGHPTGTTTGVAYARYMFNQSEIGSISQNGTTGVSYNTTSDYRLKENVVAIAGGISRLLQLKPSRFNFITEPAKTVDGFLAHEAQAVVPECVTGDKDAVDADGNPVMQGIDQSKLVPLLTAALQEAIAKIEALETRLTAAGIA